MAVENLSNSADDGVKGRMIALLVGALVVVAAVTGLIIWFAQPDEVDSAPTPVELSETDRSDIQLRLSSFLSAAGSFGFRSEALTPEVILDAPFIAEGESGSVVFVSRQSAYENVRDLIHRSGPLWFERSMVADWPNEFEVNSLSTFEIVNSEFDVPSRGAFLTLGGSESSSVEVEVEFTSTQTTRHQTATDESWDGVFDVMRRDFPDNTMTVTLAKDDSDEWRIYSVRGLDREFLLAVWGWPDASQFPNDQHGFEKFDTINVDLEEL